MPLLTTAQLQEIRQIIEDHHDAFVVNTIGAEVVPPETLTRLQELGLVNVKVASVKDAYIYGQLLATLQSSKIANMSYADFKQHLRKNPIPLSEAENHAVEMAQMNAGQYARGLGNGVNILTGDVVFEADAALRARTEGIIRDATALNLARRETVQQLKSDLGWAAKDWARDWKRIAVTEKQTAMQRGVADHYRNRYGGDVLVAKRPMPDACKQCKRVYLSKADGQPRIFKLSELEANGTNVGRKANDWLAVVGTVHPWCQCQMIRIPEGWGFDEDGDLVPGGKLGKSYADAAELARAMLQEDDLQKAFKLQGHINFHGIPVAIENKKGTTRKWKTPDGGTGETKMLAGYGYVKRTKGLDEDEIDVFVGPDPGAKMVYIIEQQIPETGVHDEQKCMLGFSSQKQAEQLYLDSYDRPGFKLYTTPMALDQFKRWCDITRPVKGEMMQKSESEAPKLRLVIPLNDDLVKAKYKKRWRGPDGKWRYEYDEPGDKRGAKQEKRKRFESKMVSPANQELDGGSYAKYKTGRDMSTEILRRVEAGTKPLGNVVVRTKSEYFDTTEDIAWIKKQHARLKKNKKIVVSDLRPGRVEDTLTFDVAQKGTLGELFDLDALAGEYRHSGVPGVADHILGFKGAKLSDFFGRWDVWQKKDKTDMVGTHPWLTGLLLGYPVANTMKRLLGVKMKKGLPAHVGAATSQAGNRNVTGFAPNYIMGDIPAKPKPQSLKDVGYRPDSRELTEHFFEGFEAQNPLKVEKEVYDFQEAVRFVRPMVVPDGWPEAQAQSREGHEDRMFYLVEERLRNAGRPKNMAEVADQKAANAGVEEIKKAVGGLFIGPRGGKWANPEHTIPWKEPTLKLKPKRVPIPRKLVHLAAQLPPGKTPAQHATLARKILKKHVKALPHMLANIRSLAGKKAHVAGRVKEMESALGKLVRKPGEYPSADKLQDCSGVRVIHDSIDQVLATVTQLKEKYTVLDEDDYITQPENHYRSYHLILEDKKTGLAFEVQVRTENQDVFADWAHHLYKPLTKEQAEHKDDPAVLEYERDISEYFWAKDTGKKPLPAKPKCMAAIAVIFGCL